MQENWNVVFITFLRPTDHTLHRHYGEAMKIFFSTHPPYILLPPGYIVLDATLFLKHGTEHSIFCMSIIVFYATHPPCRMPYDKTGYCSVLTCMTQTLLFVHGYWLFMGWGICFGCSFMGMQWIMTWVILKDCLIEFEYWGQTISWQISLLMGIQLKYWIAYQDTIVE